MTDPVLPACDAGGRPSRARPGLFIAFEGNEGSGKSTQARRLAETLRAEGYETVLTREPGGSPLAENLRALVVQGDPDSMDAVTETLIFTAARRDHLNRVIHPALETGKIVICDRYLGSTYALQGAGAGVCERDIAALHDIACTTMPDLTLCLRLPAKAALQRTLGREGLADLETRFERKGRSFHERVEASFAHQAASNPDWREVDAEGSIEDVFQRVRGTLSELGI